MYNRYIPQSDGSYQRNRMPEPSAPRPPQPPVEKSPPKQPTPPPPPPCDPHFCPHIPPAAPKSPPCKRQVRTQETKHDFGVTSFLRGLLPRDFDTEDLIVILLLLLMAGDCREDQNSALLTLALYLFL